MDYPNEEELAELQGLDYLPSTQNEVISQNAPKTPHQPLQHNHSQASINSFFHNNSLLSQIPLAEKTSDTYLGAQVNRRLFDSPAVNSNGLNRVSSTPFPTAETINNILFRPLPNEGEEHNLRKRRLDQLFGDIADINDLDDERQPQFDRNVFYAVDEDEQMRKKARSEEELDRQMIEKILALRAISRSQSTSALRQTKLEQLEALRKFKARNLSETFPNWPSQIVSVDVNERLYVRMHSEEFEKNQLKEINVRKSAGNNLLGEASDEIWNDAQAIVQKRMVAPAVLPTDVPNDSVILSEPAVLETSNKLWVEKYRPKGYFDLLSDETTNRSLLTWLKMWDKMVFNREFHADQKTKSIKPNAGSNFNKKTGKFEVGGVRFRKGRQSDLKSEIDSFGRPMQKIAVLCGPPGLGKTTLAHTIARHAGYAVREINASDDRSPDSFRLALQNGTEMQTSIMNQERRPNCIILDEIDGAPIASIEYLVRFISDHPKEQSKGSSVGQQKPGVKKSKMAGILRRPIICICNDLYTPSLRPLRQVAFIVNFPPLESSRLAERLMWISRKERLRTDLTTLLALIDKSGNDVRSCISVLQFYANSNKPLTLADVMKSNIGQKDRQKGLFDIWSAIFQIQRAKAGSLDPFKATEANQKSKEIIADIGDDSVSKRVENILNIVHMGGDHDRLINGVYENYLSQKMPDGNMLGISEATNWFCFSDQLQTLIHSQQNYAIYPYLQFGFVVWHLLFSSMAWPKIIFPTQGFEFYQKSSTQQSVRQAFLKNMSVTIRSLGNSKTIISDAIANIRQIICPALRSVSLQLLTPKERSDLLHTVEVMADLGLTYAQMKSMEGTYQYQLEPDITILCNFKELQKSELTYSNMQIIAREVELEMMRRSTPKQSEMTSKQKTDKLKKQILGSSNKPNHLQKLISKPINKSKIKDVVTKDFFGRITEKQVSLPVQEGGTDQIVKSPIWYRYKEGFNNAVRKEVTMKSLL